MRFITVEILNDKALALLHQLERLNLLRLVSSQKKTEMPKRNWAGSLSKETADRMLQYHEQSRNEWERNI